MSEVLCWRGFVGVGIATELRVGLDENFRVAVLCLTLCPHTRVSLSSLPDQERVQLNGTHILARLNQKVCMYFFKTRTSNIHLNLSVVVDIWHGFGLRRYNDGYR